MNYNPYSIESIKKLLKNRGLVAQKRFGQNFLIDSNISSKIINLMSVKEGDLVLEIGSGLGALTYKLLEKKCMVVSFEIDIGFIEILKEEFKNYDNFILVEGDFLRNFKTFHWQKYIKDSGKVVICGNIPYNVTKEILETTFSSEFRFDNFCFMVQREVLTRLLAEPKTKEYSYISILSKLNKNIKHKFYIDKGCFYPSPNVDSAVVIFEKNSNFELRNRELFFRVAKSLFLNRRKKIHNNLMMSTLLSDIEKRAIIDVLDRLDIDKNMRGEEMDIDSAVQFSNAVYDSFN